MSKNCNFLRLPQVLKRIPVSKSTWWAGVREGVYPKGVKLSTRTTAWRESDIDDLCDRLQGNEALRPVPAMDQYNDNLTNPRAPGGGCHSWIMTTANLGELAGMESQKLQDDIRCSIPTGSRLTSDREINDAISRALQDHNSGTFTPCPGPDPVVQDGKTALHRIIDQGEYSDEAHFDASTSQKT
jgi:prophage regulatory protein